MLERIVFLFYFFFIERSLILMQLEKKIFEYIQRSYRNEKSSLMRWVETEQHIDLFFYFYDRQKLYRVWNTRNFQNIWFFWFLFNVVHEHNEPKKIRDIKQLFMNEKNDITPTLFSSKSQELKVVWNKNIRKCIIFVYKLNVKMARDKPFF